MNERIKQLAEQAQQYAEYITPQGCEWFDTFKEKFAELIIRECADIATINQYEAFSSGYYVKKHFGVEDEPTN
jgi:hypothetical protein